ncbi:MAG: LuxR C-terminal-related transcriptional regulator [Oscillospiraceae bacterium]
MIVHTETDEKNYDKAWEMLCNQEIMRLDAAALAELDGQLTNIPKDIIAQTPAACMGALCVDLRCDRVESARHRYAQLAALRDASREGTKERAILSQYVCCAGLCMPKIDNARLLLLLAILFNEYQGRYKMPNALPLSLTWQRPSVLRGAKDLSEWGKNYRAVASIVGPMLSELFNDRNHGIVAAATAELLYEYNDLNAAAVEVAAALSCNIPEVAFAGMAQVVRINYAETVDSKRISELLSNMERLIEESGSNHLMPTYQALCVRLAIQGGQLDIVNEWLDNCGVDEMQCNHSHSYELMTKAKALIAMGHHRDAVTLLERILLILREDFCPLDTIECLADCAVACELLNDRNRALDKLEEALCMAEPYHYVRVIADCGSVMLRLLSQLHKEDMRLEKISHRYLRTVTDAAHAYSILHPTLYNRIAPHEAKAPPELTPMEIQILHLLEEGKSNREIGETLDIKVPTVKFHLANLFDKMEAPNRTAAINCARNLHLL